MILLAFDLATDTGIAVGDSRGAPSCETERLGEAGDHHGARFAQALRMTRRLITRWQPVVVAIEAPLAAGQSTHGGLMAKGLRGCILGVAHIHGLRVVEYDVATIRKHFIGHGRLPRAEAKRAVLTRCKQLGWRVRNDNEADACAVWDYARMIAAGRTTPPPGGLF